MSDYDAGYDVGHEDGYKSGVRETTRILTDLITELRTTGCVLHLEAIDRAEARLKSGVRETTRILHRPDRGTAGHRRRETGGDAQRAARQKALIEASMTPYAYDMRKWWSPVPAPRGGGRR